MIRDLLIVTVPLFTLVAYFCWKYPLPGGGSR